MWNSLRTAARREVSRKPLLQSQRRWLARRKGGQQPKSDQVQVIEKEVAPPPALPEYGAWKPVVHKESGMVYYWNTDTNQTTALGELPPGAVSTVVGGHAPQQPGLGRAMAEGAVFGVGAGMGSGIARGIIGSMFGGDGDEGDVGGGGDGGDGGWI